MTDGEGKALSLADRWAMDEKAGAGMVVRRCHRCGHNNGAGRCAVYGTIPHGVAAGKKTCLRYAKLAD